MTASIAIQLYTLRTLSDDPAELVHLAADLGFDGVEATAVPGDVEAFARALTRGELQLCSSHVPLAELEADPEAVFDAQRAFGNDRLVVPWLDPEDRPRDASGWRALGGRLGKLAETCLAAGMGLAYHHHAFELVEVGGKLALEHVLDGVHDLGLQIDLGWCAAAGVDPLRLIDRYAGRIETAHCKDRAPIGSNEDEEGWADLGHGTLDWRPLLGALREADVRWWIVEHDAPRDPERTARRGLAFLRARQ